MNKINLVWQKNELNLNIQSRLVLSLTGATLHSAYGGSNEPHQPSKKKYL